jgi:hypothetical protein
VTAGSFLPPIFVLPAEIFHIRGRFWYLTRLGRKIARALYLLTCQLEDVYLEREESLL